MASRLYPKFLDLARRWPEEPKSVEKHLGKVLRAVVAKHYPQGSISKVADEKQLNAIYESFNKLSNGVHSANYPRQFTSSATGLKAKDVEVASIADVFGLLRLRAEGNQGIRSPGAIFKNTLKKVFGKSSS